MSKIALPHTGINKFHRYIHSLCNLFRRHSTIQKALDSTFHILSDFDNMLIRIIEANDSLPSRMFHNRVDIFNIIFLQLISKLVKVIFLKIKLKVVAIKRNVTCTNKFLICFQPFAGLSHLSVSYLLQSP